MYYSYQDFLQDLCILKERVEKGIGVPDALVCIARGGMTMSHMLGLVWNIRSVYCLNAISYTDKKIQTSLVLENLPVIKPSHKKILVVDEIVDSGKSLDAVIQKLRSQFPASLFYTATIFQKPDARIKADYCVKEPSEWVDFFWEVDILEKLQK